MDVRMVRKAMFLIREVHASRQDAVHALLEYFPGSAFEDRLRCVHEAWDMLSRSAHRV